ncbi:MAG: hypothetical protein ACLP01_24315 [Solirubrobacteraceae bacterium]
MSAVSDATWAPAACAPAPATLADRDGAPAYRVGVIVTSLLSGAVLVAMQVMAVFNSYSMRVTSDTPTFIALVRELARAPMQPDSVFFNTLDTQSIHASPYMQALGLLWRAMAPAGHLGDPMAIGRFLAIMAIPVTLFTLGMLWLFTRSVAGRTAAFAAIPAVLSLFGPAHIIFSSDLTLGGLLATGYYPTTLAAGLSLAVLMLLRKRSKPASVATVLLLALTLTIDLFSGTVLLLFTITYSCIAARRERSEARRIPGLILGAFALAALWPMFHIFAAFDGAGIPVLELLVGAFVAPWLWCLLAPRLAVLTRSLPGLARLARAHVGAAGELRVALFGLWACAILALWALYLIGHWPDNPALQSYRLGLYWDDQVYRWPLLLAPGAVGAIGLQRLVRRGAGELALAAGAMYAVGVVGSIVFFATHLQLPLYYRFILACQLPMAVGMGAFLAHHKSRRAAKLAWATLVLAFAFKALTLVCVSTNQSYFGSPLQSAWTLGQVIGPDTGRVASDPSTSYYIPAAAGDPVVTLSGHADSGAEPRRADIGYRLMHELYAGDDWQSADALLHLWLDGVRWVVVEKFTSLRPADRQLFFFGPYSGLVTRSDMALMARYYSRLAAAGTQVYDDNEYTVFKLDGRRLEQAINAPASIAPQAAGRIRNVLVGLAEHRDQDVVRDGAELYRLGVRIVTVSVGTFGSQPHIYGFGQSLSAPDMVSSAVTAPGLGCRAVCYRSRDLGWMARLGRVLHSDNRFMTVVALSAPGTPAPIHASTRSTRRLDT